MIKIRFSLWLSDGTPVDATEADEVMVFEAGDGQWLPALETLILSVPAGETRQFLLAPDQAFGWPDAANRHRMPRQALVDLEPEPGKVLEFELPSGEAVAATVLSVDEQQVELDFSHPLAGRELILEVERVE